MERTDFVRGYREAYRRATEQRKTQKIAAAQPPKNNEVKRCNLTSADGDDKHVEMLPVSWKPR